MTPFKTKLRWLSWVYLATILLAGVGFSSRLQTIKGGGGVGVGVEGILHSRTSVEQGNRRE